MLIRQMLPIQLIQNYLNSKFLPQHILKLSYPTFNIIKITDLTKYMPIFRYLTKTNFSSSNVTNKQHEKSFER